MTGQDDQREDRHRLPRWFKVLATIIALLILLFICWHLILQASVDEAMDEIKAKGEPTNYDEVEALYPEPIGENLAIALVDAFGYLVEETDQDRLTKLPLMGGLKWQIGDPIPEDSKPIVADLLLKNATAIEMLHQAALIEHGKHQIDYRGIDTLLPHLGNLKKMSNLLVLDAITASARHDIDRAIDSLVAAMSLGRSLKGEPILISMMVRVACDNQAYRAMQKVVGEHELTDAQLSRLAETLEWSDYDGAMYLAMLGERVLGVSVFDRPNQGGYFGPMPWLALHRAAGTMKLDQLTYIEFMNAYVEAARLPSDKRCIEFDRISSEFEVLVQSKIKKFTRPITMFTFPALNKASEVELEVQVQREVTRLGIAIERYRLAEGMTPGTLADVTPKYLPTVPTDPFSGKPMQYKLTIDGFAVYSVGEDSTDDGGSGDDIAFDVKR